MSETVTINSFSRWEQAFHIFANIYTSEFPQGSSELIQYNHIIHSIAGMYTWDNVYAYDREFRLHIGRHPERSWLVILQQAWSMKLRDRLTHGGGTNSFTSNSQQPVTSLQLGGGPPKGKSSDACRRFNKGYCKFGTICRCNHKCLYCNKFGHTVLTCHKLIADRERANKKTSHSSGAGGDDIKDIRLID